MVLSGSVTLQIPKGNGKMIKKSGPCFKSMANSKSGKHKQLTGRRRT